MSALDGIGQLFDVMLDIIIGIGWITIGTAAGVLVGVIIGVMLWRTRP